MSDVVKTLAAITEPVERAKACQAFITNGRATLKAVQRLRDEAIRLASGTATIDTLARGVGCRRNIVVDALRGPR